MSLRILKSLKVPSMINDKITILRNIILKFQNSKDLQKKMLKHPQRGKKKSHTNIKDKR